MLKQENWDQAGGYTHTHTQALFLCFALYLQGSKHHHFLLCALNFLQQDGPLGLFVELVHTDGIILWRGLSQRFTSETVNAHRLTDRRR